MKMVDTALISRAGAFIRDQGRDLETAMFQLFLAGSSATREQRGRLIAALRRYQNSDGGFGHGLESDFRLPDSSAMATSVALRIIHDWKWTGFGGELDELVEPAIGYLEGSYDACRRGWWAVPPEVNRYPHAPWWHYDEEEGMTMIDRYWGNPSAEILAYLRVYQGLVKCLPVDNLIEFAMRRMLDQTDYSSEHEVFCYIRLCRQLPSASAHVLGRVLKKAVRVLVCTQPEQWDGYLPRPLDFAPSRCLMAPLGLTQQEVDTQLDYIILQLDRQGGIWPHWSWDQEPVAWKRAQREWAGQLTLAALLLLDSYGRILW